jgi:hypothetical protein
MDCVATTKYFFVLNISRRGPQTGFSVHGSITSDVQKAIRLSDIPRLLYIRVDTMAMATNGNPSAK